MSSEYWIDPKLCHHRCGWQPHCYGGYSSTPATSTAVYLPLDKGWQHPDCEIIFDRLVIPEHTLYWSCRLPMLVWTHLTTRSGKNTKGRIQELHFESQLHNLVMSGLLDALYSQGTALIAELEFLSSLCKAQSHYGTIAILQLEQWVFV